MSDHQSQPLQKLSFEEALRELDAVVEQLEAGKIPLEDSLKLLERGMALANLCDETLSRAESTIEQLVATEEGELVAHRLRWSDEEEDEDDITDEDGNAEDE